MSTSSGSQVPAGRGVDAPAAALAAVAATRPASLVLRCHAHAVREIVEKWCPVPAGRHALACAPIPEPRLLPQIHGLGFAEGFSRAQKSLVARDEKGSMAALRKASALGQKRPHELLSRAEPLSPIDEHGSFSQGVPRAPWRRGFCGSTVPAGAMTVHGAVKGFGHRASRDQHVEDVSDDEDLQKGSAPSSFASASKVQQLARRRQLR